MLRLHKLTADQKKQIILQLLQRYQFPSIRSLTYAMQALKIDVSHTTVTRHCNELEIIRVKQVCGADPYITTERLSSTLCPPCPLWYLYARINVTLWRGLRKREDQELLKKACQLNGARKSKYTATVTYLEDYFTEIGHRWWEHAAS